MNFFKVEQAMVDRIKANMPEIVEVFLSDSIADLLTKPPKMTPVAYVIYDGYSLTPDAKTTQDAQLVTQRWLVLVVTRNTAGGMLKVSTVRQPAGDYIGRMLGLFLGWVPPELHRGLKLAEAPKPMYGPQGIDFYPVAFETVIPVTKDKSIP